MYIFNVNHVILWGEGPTHLHLWSHISRHTSWKTIGRIRSGTERTGKNPYKWGLTTDADCGWGSAQTYRTTPNGTSRAPSKRRGGGFSSGDIFERRRNYNFRWFSDEDERNSKLYTIDRHAKKKRRTSSSIFTGYYFEYIWLIMLCEYRVLDKKSE